MKKQVLLFTLIFAALTQSALVAKEHLYTEIVFKQTFKNGETREKKVEYYDNFVEYDKKLWQYFPLELLDYNFVIFYGEKRLLFAPFDILPDEGVPFYLSDLGFVRMYPIKAEDDDKMPEVEIVSRLRRYLSPGELDSFYRKLATAFKDNFMDKNTEEAFKDFCCERLEYLRDEQLRILRNTIYASHGYVFKDEELQDVFNSCYWYSINPDFSEAEFSALEKKYLEAIKTEERGERYVYKKPEPKTEKEQSALEK